MARIKLAPEFETINGRRGDLVLYSYYDRQYARVHITPRNPNTAAQVFVRRTFGDAVRAWQALDHDSKRKFIKKGRMRRINGYNLFISEYIKERMPSLSGVNGDSLSRGYSKPIVPMLLQCSSNAPPFPHRCRPVTAINHHRRAWYGTKSRLKHPLKAFRRVTARK